MTGAAVLQVTTTTASKEDARRLARLLVDERLAACVQIVGPIESVYRWQGAVETAHEWLLVAKTTEANYPSLDERLATEHPYEVPEILAVPVADGSDAYLDWVRAGTRRD